VTIDIKAFAKRNAGKLMLLAPLAAFTVPLVWLYLLNPVSFDNMWKGRTFELFFVWLILLELILGWESLQKRMTEKISKIRLGALLFALLLPTIYVVASNYLGINTAIVAFSERSGIAWPWSGDMPVVVEYLVFAGFFSLMAFLIRSFDGLKRFSIPILFSIIVGTVFLIDNVYPYGQFTPFQFLVPITTMLASNALNLMGYKTALDTTHGNLPQLTVIDPNNPVKSVTFGVAWPCAGIESLLIFTVTLALFLKRMPISWQAKLGYFAFGAAITYLLNIFRIVSIFLWSLGGGNEDFFHQFIGPLYPIVWIVSYPLIILASQSLWSRIKARNKSESLENPESSPNPRG
jgi:exosortase/archaeosortase family protein